MPDEIRASTPTLRQSAIRQVALQQRNPFFASQRIAIQDKDFGRSPGERVMASQAFQIASRLIEDSLAAFAEAISLTLGLLTGLALAVPLIVIPLVTACFLMCADHSSSVEASLFSQIGAFLLSQSWRHYVGWLLSGVTAFFCPYLLLGLPLDCALRFFRPVHGLVDARKMLRALERDSGNDDPAALVSAPVSGPLSTMDPDPFPRPVARIWWIVAGFTVAVSGVGVMACFVILYIKLGALRVHQDLLIAVTIGTLMFAGLYFPCEFLGSRIGMRAVEELISGLSQGEPYGKALGHALTEFQSS